MAALASLYRIRIKGRLGATALSAFPSMATELMGSETVLTGWLEDQSALFGVLARSKDSASNCSSSDKSGPVRDRLNQAMTAHQMACEAKAMDAMTTVASSTGFSEQGLSWILNAYTHGNRAAEAEANADG